MRRIIYIIMLAVAVASCTGAMQQRLGEIESAIDTDSAAAYGALLAVDTTSLTAADDRALYDLLIVEKAVKNYEPVTPDVIMRARRAADYYGSKPLSVRRADAIFYLGRACQHAKDYPAAIGPALAALDDATALRDTFRMAKAHDLLGDIYVYSYLVGPELPHRRAAKDLHKNLDENPLFYAYAVIDLAECLYNNNLSAECIALLDSNKSFFDTIPSYTRCYYQASYVRPLIDLKQIDRAKHILLSMLDSPDSVNMNLIDYQNIINIYLRQDSIDAAQKWYSLMEQRFPASSYRHVLLQSKYQILKHLGKTELALPLIDSLYSQLDRLSMSFLRSHMQDYVQAYHIKKNKKAKTRHYRSVVLFSLAVLTLTVLLIWLIVNYRRRMRKISQPLETKINNLKLLCDELQTQLDDRDTDSRESHISGIYISSFNALNEICDIYFRKKNQGKTVITLNSVIEKELNRLRDGEYLKLLEAEIDADMNNLITDLKLNISKISAESVALLQYSIMGFPPRIIAFLLGISIENFYTRRKRLRNVISQSQWDRKNEILKYISQTEA